MPTTAPAAGTPMSRVIKWVEAGTPAEPSGFHTATRDGQPTNLGEDIAFVAPSGSARCATDKNLGGQLACLIKADDLPSKPADVEGQWIPGWVDFAGETVDVGSLHGDPGRFGYGDGAQLAEGKSLAFGDYRCRADATTLVCVNYAHQSGVLLNSSGVEPLGCLKPVPPPVGVGRQLRCPPDSRQPSAAFAAWSSASHNCRSSSAPAPSSTAMATSSAAHRTWYTRSDS